MSEIAETQLPGVGVRYDFTTEDGRRVGVIHRYGGRREMFVCPADDPDTATLTIELTDDDAHTLVEVLGVSRVIEALHQLQQMEGLALDWLRITDGSPCAGRTIGDARIRTRTGASVVAAIRGGAPHPAPGPEFRLEAGDTVVVVGTAGGIEAVRSIIASG